MSDQPNDPEVVVPDDISSIDDVADVEAPASADEDATPPPPPTVEDLVVSLEAVTAERDDYLDGLLRLQAEFENYRKAVAKREQDARERANESLVAELLPVLDACEGAIANNADGVVPIHASFVEVLKKQGLEQINPIDAPFNPEAHEAVMHEPAEGDERTGRFSSPSHRMRVEGPHIAGRHGSGEGWALRPWLFLAHRRQTFTRWLVALGLARESPTAYLSPRGCYIRTTRMVREGLLQGPWRHEGASEGHPKAYRKLARRVPPG
ncbi:MAG: nucleotide exchange factor GrpE [Acidimicrobiales bacterium]